MVAYVRRSKKNRKRPDDPAYGIEAQRTATRNAATANDWHLVWAPADDGATGAHTHREGLTWALAQLAAGQVDDLVIAKLNGPSRSVADFAQVLRLEKKQRWSVVALDLGIDTPTVNGRLVANIVMSVARWEREIISQRTVEALAEANESGVKPGRPILVPKPVILAHPPTALQGPHAQPIADQLNADQGPTTHGGNRWHSSTIRGVLSRSGGDPNARTHPPTPAGTA
ncbi:recombinase family protein [Micromonospora sp. CPCC 205558]|uniref:recombinase family protein n=1 Tax=Micromonospora sp. CPCC 205558 TaxID=3122403 RepID=UPI002FF41065